MGKKFHDDLGFIIIFRSGSSRFILIIKSSSILPGRKCRAKKTQPKAAFFVLLNGNRYLNRYDFLSLRALSTIDNLELNSLPIFQRLETITLDSAKMNKNVWTVFLFNETKTLFVVKPLNNTRYCIIRHNFLKKTIAGNRRQTRYESSGSHINKYSCNTTMLQS
jgi:hypothetical protein